MDVLERLKNLQDRYGWSDYRIAKEAGLSSGTVSNIYKRNTLPNIDTLEAICNGFGITLSQFFSDNDTIELTPKLKDLFENWATLSNENQELVMNLIKALN